MSESKRRRRLTAKAAAIKAAEALATPISPTSYSGSTGAGDVAVSKPVAKRPRVSAKGVIASIESDQPAEEASEASKGSSDIDPPSPDDSQDLDNPRSTILRLRTKTPATPSRLVLHGPRSSRTIVFKKGSQAARRVPAKKVTVRSAKVVPKPPVLLQSIATQLVPTQPPIDDPSVDFQLISSSPPPPSTQLPSSRQQPPSQQKARSPLISPQPSSPPQKVLRYQSIWTLILKKEGKKDIELATATYRDLSRYHPLLEKVRDWSFKKASEAGAVVQRFKSEAYHKGVKSKTGRWLADLDEERDFQGVIRMLIEWCELGYTDIRLDLRVEASTVETVTQSQSKTTNQPTAIERQRSRMAAALDALPADQNIAVDLRERWMCKQQSCRNYGEACWWLSRDTADQHRPLTRNIYTLWSRDILVGTTTVEQPTLHVAEQFKYAREAKNQKGVGGVAATATPPPATPAHNVHIHMPGATPAPGPVPVLAPISSTEPLLEKSPRECPASSPPAEHDTVERINAFFAWLRERTNRWRSETTDLLSIKLALIEYGCDLSGVQDITTQDWRAFNLKPGQRRRIIREIGRFNRWSDNNNSSSAEA
nr:hypothetical protein CFP56_02538 [Quercus suber]